MNRNKNIKKPRKVYLSDPAYNNLIERARVSGFQGHGSLSKFLEAFAFQDYIIISSDVKKLSALLKPLFEK